MPLRLHRICIPHTSNHGRIHSARRVACCQVLAPRAYFGLTVQHMLPISIAGWLSRRQPFLFPWRILACVGISPLLCLHASTHPPENALDHWAFQPVPAVTVPDVGNDSWPRTVVDAFILARLVEHGQRPAPLADPRALLRRMTFDLTGLPPTPEEMDHFLAAAARDRDAAVQEAINRLLTSPRYGERWGRHWLDVARYSDTKGYVYAREERRFVHASTYRNWVIDAFNRNLPYDRFLLLQLAADQLVPPDSPDLAAMGFLTGGRRFIGVTHDIIDDRIDVATRGTMALTVQCARCHDHKYDPIPTADYYSLYGVFHNSDDRLVTLAPHDDEELATRREALRSAMTQRRDEAAQRLRQRVADYLAAQLDLDSYPEEGFDQILTEADLIPASVRRWRDFLDTTADARHPIFGPWVALAALPEDAFGDQASQVFSTVREQSDLNPLIAEAFATPVASMTEAAQRYGAAFAKAEADADAAGAAALRTFLRAPDSPTTVPDTDIVNNELYFPTSVVEALWNKQGDVDRRLLELNAAAALILSDGPPEPNPRIFKRGRASQLGEEVPRRFLGLISGSERQPFHHGSGRLELATAITAPDNPLTARVMVNRIWQHHFGLGLVLTPSDFGTRADPPSHPALLDWLARRFVQEGWSLKAMHRLILSSAVYQQSSSNPAASGSADFHARDPDNRLLSHYPVRRMDFEQLRDGMLAVSGDLDLDMTGPARGLLDADNRRRTVYAFVDRQFLTGTFRTFDFANPDIHVAVRHETTVPQQALFFLNGRFAADRARSLLRGMEALPDEARVQALHRVLYQRAATSEETAAALAFVAQAETITPEKPPPPPVTQWQYGTGEYDPGTGRLKSFIPLPHFTGSAWQGAEDWPGGETGWAQLTADGGHPGNTLAHACVRRWVAPHDAFIRIDGVLKHEPPQGDGIRAFIVSSQQGTLKSVPAHQNEVPMALDAVEVQEGDTIDFIVDIGDTLNSDQFLWRPLIRSGDDRWDARTEFGGPLPLPDFLTPWEQYAQVLLLANEFAFLD